MKGFFFVLFFILKNFFVSAKNFILSLLHRKTFSDIFNMVGKIVIKIVLTGGPCAGKTTALAILVEYLTKRGWKVLTAPEVVTELITSGLSPKDIPSKMFQLEVIKYQKEKENRLERLAYKYLPYRKILIICDRGALDCKAYTDDGTFKEVLQDLHTTEVELRDKYGAVFHMVTAADGAEEFYTLSNNQARSESPEEAREIDRKIKKAWTGHPHFRVIDNHNKTFEQKISLLLKEICSFLGEPVPSEIERSFLIRKPDIEYLASKVDSITEIDIRQTYLRSSNPDVERRVRQRGSHGSFIYLYAEKTGKSKLNRIEKEALISQEYYSYLLREADLTLHPIIKKRYCFLYESVYYELDIYPQWEDRAIVEIELNSEDEIVSLPSFLGQGTEVTSDNRYKNHSLASGVFPKDDLIA